MSQTTPPRPQGQIETPNPVELFWEKNRRMVITVVVAAAFAIGLKYAITYSDQAKVDALWGDFASVTNLDRQYVSPEVPAIAQIFQSPDSFGNQASGLISQLGPQLAQSDPASLSTAIQETAGTHVEPLLLWVAAYAATEKREWDRAVALLNDLKSRFPDHPLCVETDYPVQYREPVEEDEENPPDPLQPPEFAPEVSGSQVTAALARIDREREFERQESRFYEPIPAAEDSPRVKVTTSLGSFTLALYQDRAPEHVERFLARVSSGFYDGQHVDEIARTADSFAPKVEEFHFGLESSKTDIRTAWNRTAPAAEDALLDYVETPAQGELSHFPGTLAAAPEADGKSSAERYWINVNDCASSMDGTRVIVGRVVEGMEVLDLIVGAPFFTDAEATAGRGQPRELIRIEKIERL